MKAIIRALIVEVFAIVFSSCFTAGTHGSIKSYNFPVTKIFLQYAVNRVINQGPNIRIAPIRDTFTSKYYNDGERYMTIEIGKPAEFSEYTFQFTGEKESWDTAQSSEISISYAYNKNGGGGSIENGGFSSCKKGIRQEIINVFETQFIDKIDTVLKYKTQLQ